MTACLVLGGNGFMGSHVVDALSKEGYYVKVLDSNLEKINYIPRRNVTLLKEDFTDIKDTGNALKDVDIIFHFISFSLPQTTLHNPLTDIDKNITNSVKFFQEVQKKGVEKIIFASSGGTIYGEPLYTPINETHPTNPFSPYAISKLCIEKYLHYFYKIYGLKYISLRYSNVYGERQNPYPKVGFGAVAVFLGLIKLNKEISVYGDGNAVRDYVYVEDVVEANLHAMKHKKSDVFNIGAGVGTSTNELINLLKKVTGREAKVNHLLERKGDINKIVLDISKAKNELNWKPEVNLEEGIKKTWKWIDENF